MKICITTYYDSAFASIGQLCRNSLETYANLYKIDVSILDHISSDRPAAWNKLLVIKKLFAENYDYVFWIDAYAIFVDFQRDIRAELKEKKQLYLVKHMIESKEVPNTGIIIIKKSEWSSRLLDLLWAKHEYIRHKWWENAAMIEILGYHELLTEGKPNQLNGEILREIQWLGLEWNSLPGICAAEHPVINHYAGRPMDYRVTNMMLDAQNRE